MTWLRLARYLSLSLVLAFPATGFASPRSVLLTLQSAQLRCPQCTCERARSDLLLVRREYREVHAKASMSDPQAMIVVGFAGAAAVTGVTALVSVLALMTPAGGRDAGDEERSVRNARRVWRTGGLIMTLPLTIGFSGVGWYVKRYPEAAPYHQRDAELRVAFREAKQTYRARCRGVPRRGAPRG